MRRQINKNVDDLFQRLTRRPTRKNAVTPEMLMGPMWIQHNESSGVEIIELNSSCDEDLPKENNANDTSHAWSYVNNEDIQKQDHLNGKTRQNTNPETFTLPSTFSSADIDEFVETFYDSHIKDRFDIINKNFTISESSSEEEYRDVEMITSSDMIIDNNTWNSHDNSFYNEDMITYNTALDEDTQTIWIYSFKNRHPLANEDLGELDNERISSSSSTCYSTDSSGEQRSKSKPSNRIRSPMPSAYIPRLDLSQLPTLSTVTEMSEANAQPVKNSTQSSKVKQPNNWFITENQVDSKKSTNIISRLCLSPRKYREMVKNASCNDTWIGSHMTLEGFYEDKIDNGNQTNDIVNDGQKVTINVEMHTDVKKSENVANEVKSINTDVKSNVTITRPNKINYTDAVNKDFQNERGDHDLKLEAPVLHLSATSQKSERSRKCEYKTNIGNNTYNVQDNFESNADRNNNSVDQLYLKNTIIMKYSQGTQYTRSPTNQTPVSYHLSLGSIINERKSWCRRLMNLICCK